MNTSDFYFREKIPVAVLGATGCVGQKLIQLIENHPWFRVAALCASERSAGKKYHEAVHWLMPTPIPVDIGDRPIEVCHPKLSEKCLLAFSGLDSTVAGPIETDFAKAGYVVVSNSSNHRMDPDVPLIIPEVNPDHLQLLKKQKFGKGMIVTNPNCSVIGLTLALKPLWDHFGIESVHVVTLQAVSGAGYPGVPCLDIVDNILPFISGEAEKIETETLKLLGHLQPDLWIKPAEIKISAQCNRVAVTEGHTACVSVKLKKNTTSSAIRNAWETFIPEPQRLHLPSAPSQALYYFSNERYPQPKLHRDIDKGMAVSIGRLHPCRVLDYKFVLLSHNTIRGAAGAALLNAELLIQNGLLSW